MKKNIIVGLLRISVGFVFLWAFFDKVFGLGFATAADKSWIYGNSPTYGFLKFGTSGIFKPIFENMAGSQIVDWLFMLGLLGIGLSLVLGILQKISTMLGTILLLLMLLAAFPPKNNPLIDEHLIYILVLQLLLQLHSGEVFGLGAWWKKTGLVKKFPFLI